VRSGLLTGAAALLVAVSGCTGSGAPVTPSVTIQTLTGRLTDPAGDAVPRPSIAVAPDLVSALVEVTGGTMTISIALASGTLSPSQTMCSVLFDTDENAATGSPGVDSSASDAALIGVDYSINAVSPRGSMQAQLYRATGPNQFTVIGTAGVLFVGPDQFRIGVPLTALGNDDGRLRFSLDCAQWLTDTTTTGVTDYMPDLGTPPALVR
jgi:hypothetical protein